MVLWSVLCVYLACDFFLLRGPLKRRLDAMFPSAVAASQRDKEAGVIARVCGHPITRGQVDWRMQEHLWRRGKTLQSASSLERGLFERLGLEELIDETLLGIKVDANAKHAVVHPSEIDQAYASFMARFESEAAMHKALQSQGISLREMRYRLAAILQQEKYLNYKVEEALHIDDATLLDWYQSHKKELYTPQLFHVAHLFLAKTSHPHKQEALNILKESKSMEWSKAVASLSEDPRSALRRGDLGWLSRRDLPNDLADCLGAMPVGSEQTFESAIGYHRLRLLEVQAPFLPPFDQIKERLREDFQDRKKNILIANYRKNLRAMNRRRIVIYWDSLRYQEKKKER